MNFSKLVSTFILLIFFITTAVAQKGTIRGSVIDDGNGELLPFLNVLIEGTTIGTSTDLDGAYSISVDPGTYVLIFSYLGYSDKKITDITVAANEVKVVDVRMGNSSETIEEVIITARQNRNTESALLTLQKKSANLLDGISAQSFSKVGDADAGAAIKRVTGVSVQDGKYVFVRGLGDRYTKTLFNGNDIPGLDPDRNNVQMDIFPANLIDRIVVKKTFTPDLPGDFTGGIIDITTKDFPDSLSINFNYSTSYNPQTHFNEDFILYDGGKTDWLAFDDGTRALPFKIGAAVPDESKNNNDLTSYTSILNPTLAVSSFNNFLNQSISIGVGNQINKKNVDIGFNAALNYGLKFQYYDEVINGEYFKNTLDKTDFNLEKRRSSVARIGEQDASWSALIGTSLKIKKTNKLRFNLFHTQNGNTKASDGITNNGEDNPAEKLNNALFYTQRAMTNLGFSGDHSIKEIKVSWKGAYTKSQISDPDLRITDMNCEVDNTDPEDNCGVGVYHLDQSVGAQIRRDFRNLQEYNITGGVDVEIPFTLKNQNKTKLKLGFLETYKERDYSIQTIFVLNNDRPNDYNFDPNWFFQSENIWTTDDTRGTFIRYNLTPSNTYNATQNTFAAYAMNEMPVGQKLKIIYGVRAEYFTNWFTGNDPSAPPNAPLDYVDSLLVEDLSILPAFNLVYNVNNNMNIRAAYSKTVARPSFKEKSTVSIFDPISNRRYTGNIELKPTDIQNADLRWEYFFGKGEIISFGGFYKFFTNPIELIAKELNPSEITPVNSGNANVLGLELEFRKNFAIINERLADLSLGANFTYVDAKVKMDSIEYISRVSKALEGEVIEKTRSLFGQSPYIINAYINYSIPKTATEANLSYNIQGERLAVVGIGTVPDVFEQPINNLNFKITQPLLKNKARLSFNIDNILDAKNLQIYKSDLAIEEVYNSFQRGRTYGLGFSLNF